VNRAAAIVGAEPTAPAPNGHDSSVEGGNSGLSLLCRVNTQWCALPLSQVIETMRPLPTTAIPGAPAFVDGVAIIRGAPVPVIDLSRLLGLGTAAATRIVCVRTEQGSIALTVAAVEGVRSIGPQSLQALPPLLQCADAQVIAAIGMLDAQLLLVMRTARLITQEVWNILSAELAAK
jgi:purine-binding chemotaxis protein CheW